MASSHDHAPGPGAAPELAPLGAALTASAWAIVLAIGAALAFAHPRFLMGTLVGDDAGYYLAVARNACLGHGFSYDRLEPTNGFNPLVPMLLIPLDRLLAPGLDLVACFRIGTLVSWLAVAWSLVSARRLAARVLEAHGFPGTARPLAIGSVLFFLAAFVAPKGYYGMDAFLVLALGLAYAAAVAREGPLAPGRWPAVRDAALLAGAVLARVDSLPLAVAAFLVMVPAARRDPHGGGRLAARAALFTAAIVPYVAWNRATFGEWLPISARIKSSFPVLDPARSLDAVLHSSLNLADQAALLVALLAAASWLAGGWASLRRGGPGPPPGAADLAMTVLALGVGGRIAWLLLFSRFDVQGSYFILAHPFIALCALLLFARPASRAWAVAGPLALALVGLALLGAKARTLPPEIRAIAASRGDEWAIGRHVHDTVGPDDVVFGGALGLIGYISDRAWINGDGVANTREYQDAIRAGELARHLARRSVDYIAVPVSPPQEPGRDPLRLTFAAHLYGAHDTLLVSPADIVLRERTRRGGGSELWIVRWRPPEEGATGAQASPVPSSGRQR